MSKEHIQKKIIKLVGEYKRIFPSEYKAITEINKQTIENNRTKFGELKGTNIVERAITNIPETLYGIFAKHFNEEMMEYYNSKEGTRWFAKKFKAFSVAEKI